MKLFVLALTLLIASACSKKDERNPETVKHVEQRTLTVQLAEKAQLSAQKSAPENRKVMYQAIRDLKQSNVMNTALKTGDKMPSFELPDVQKGLVRSTDLLKQGPLLIVFYRGSWCPYCNLQLRDLQKHIAEIKSTGAELVAISPETPDGSAKTVKEQQIEYYVLSDANGEVGQKFGLMFQLNDELKQVYQKFGIDLDKANGNDKWELPLAATYIVNQEGEVVYSFVDADYKKRAETLDLIEKLKSL